MDAFFAELEYMIAGVEIGPTVLRAVAYSRYGRGRKPDRTAEAILPAPLAMDGDLAAALREPLKQLIDALGVVPGKVSVAIPDRWCLFRSVSFPYRNSGRIEHTLAFALEGRVPGDIESYIIEPVGAVQAVGEQGARVLVAACPKALLRAVIAAFEAVEIEPTLILPASVALCRFAGERPAAARHGWVVAMNSSDCSLIHRDGGEPAACCALPRDCARGEAFAAVLVRAMSLEGACAACDDARLFACDDSPEPLGEAFAEALGAPVVAEPAEDAPWPIARGAVAQARQGGTPVNLRRGELARASFGARMERRAVAAMVLAVAALCLLGVHHVRNLVADRENAVALRRAQTETMRTVLPGARTLYDLEAHVATARRNVNADKRKKMVSCLERWTDAMKRLPHPGDVSFSLIDITPSRLRIEALCRDANRADELKRALTDAPGFLPNPESRTEAADGGGTSFEITLRYE